MNHPKGMVEPKMAAHRVGEYAPAAQRRSSHRLLAPRSAAAGIIIIVDREGYR